MKILRYWLAFSRPGLILMSVALSGPLASCKTSGSQVKHDADAPVRSKSAWNWRSVQPEERKINNKSNTLPDDHALAQRMQYWVDRIDTHFRTKYPAQFAQVPTVRVEVIPDGTINAQVTSVPVCFEQPIRLGGAVGSEDAGRLAITLASGALDYADVSCGTSALRDASSAEARRQLFADFVGDFNAAGLPCRFSLDPDGTLVAGSSCAKSSYLKAVAKGKGIVLELTSNTFQIFAGIIATLPEDQLVGVIAHELGHYYRSHATAPGNTYNYFYSLDQKQLAQKPARDDSLSAEGNKALDAHQWLEAVSGFPPVPNLTIPSYMYGYMQGALDAIHQVAMNFGKTLPSACLSAEELLKSKEHRAAIGTYPWGSSAPDAAALAALSRAESTLGTCLAAIKLINGTDDDLEKANSSGQDVTITWGEFLYSVASLVPNHSESPDYFSRLQKMQLISRRATRTGYPQGATVALDGQRAFIAEFARIDAQSRLDAQKVGHFGYYTAEQEADDLSAEILAGIGIDPAAFAAANLSLAKAVAVPFLPAPDTGGCDDLRRRGWLDNSNNYVFVDLGGIADPHHAFCYRVFNISREIDAHHWQVAQVKSELLPQGDYQKLQTIAASFSNASQPGGGKAAKIVQDPSTIGQLKVKNTCVFAPKEFQVKH